MATLPEYTIPSPVIPTLTEKIIAEIEGEIQKLANLALMAECTPFGRAVYDGKITTMQTWIAFIQSPADYSHWIIKDSIKSHFTRQLRSARDNYKFETSNLKYRNRCLDDIERYTDFLAWLDKH